VATPVLFFVPLTIHELFDRYAAICAGRAGWEAPMGKSADFSRNRPRKRLSSAGLAFTAVVLAFLLLTVSVFVLPADAMAALDSVPAAETGWMSLVELSLPLLAYLVALLKISDQQRDLAFAQHCEPWR
jgi:hypothetical protein